MRLSSLFFAISAITFSLPELAFGQSTKAPECRSGFVQVEPPVGENFKALQDWVSFAKALGPNKSYSENLLDSEHFNTINDFIESKADVPLFQSINGIAYYYECFGRDKDRTRALELFELAEDEGDPIAIQVLSLQPEYRNDESWKKKKISQLKKNKGQDISQSILFSFEADKNFEKIRKLTQSGFVPFWKTEKHNKKLNRVLDPYCDLHTKAYRIWKQNIHALGGLRVCNIIPQGYNNAGMAYSFAAGSSHIGHPFPENSLDQMAIKLGHRDAIESAYRKSYEFVGLRTPVSFDDNYQRHIKRVLDISKMNRERNAQRSNTIKQQPARNNNSHGSIGFFSHEQESGLSKICYYDVLGDLKALNVSSVKICPTTHRF